MSRTENATRNIIWGTFNKFISLGMPFITRTVIIYSLGIQYVGLGGLFSSVLQILSFAELGIGNALVFSMYKPMAENDTKKVSSLLRFYRNCYRVIGSVVLGLGLLMMPFLKYLIAGDIPGDINIIFLYALYLLNSTIGYFLFAYKQSLFIASQRGDMISKLNMILQLVMGSLQIIFVLVSRSYYAFVIMIPLITCINNLITGFLAAVFYPQYKCIGKLNKAELFDIRKKTGGMIFQKVGSIVLKSADTIVISTFLGLTTLGIFQNYYYIITALFGLLSVLTDSIISSVGNSIAVDSVEKNYGDFKKFNYIYVNVVTICTVCLLGCFQPFMKLWVGAGYTLPDEYVVLFAAYFFVHKWCDMLYVYQEACGIWWETRMIPLLAAILNLSANIVLVQIIDLKGILISTIISVLFIYDIGYAKILFRTYFKGIARFRNYFCSQLRHFLVVFISSLVTGWCIRRIVTGNLLISFILNGIIALAVSLVVIWLFGKTASENADAEKWMRTLVGKLICKWRRT